MECPTGFRGQPIDARREPERRLPFGPFMKVLGDIITTDSFGRNKSIKFRGQMEVVDVTVIRGVMECNGGKG
jgi:hypothetical protein